MFHHRQCCRPWQIILLFHFEQAKQAASTWLASCIHIHIQSASHQKQAGNLTTRLSPPHSLLHPEAAAQRRAAVAMSGQRLGHRSGLWE